MTEKAAGDEINIKNLLQETYNRMRAHESIENENSSAQDSKLQGLIILVKELLSSYIKSTEYDEMIAFTLGEENQMLHEFFFENLYYLPDMTKSANKNKCKTNRSRTEAYKLLCLIMKSFKPREMAIFLEEYIWRMI